MCTLGEIVVPPLCTRDQRCLRCLQPRSWRRPVRLRGRVWRTVRLPCDSGQRSRLVLPPPLIACMCLRSFLEGLRGNPSLCSQTEAESVQHAFPLLPESGKKPEGALPTVSSRHDD